jgi:hypothetical protein
MTSTPGAALGSIATLKESFEKSLIKFTEMLVHYE